MLYAVILLCALSVEHDDCDEHTAVRWFEHPVSGQLASQCLIEGNVIGSAMKVEEGTYMMVRCRRGQPV